MSALRNRRVQDLLIAVVDGLKGFPEAITPGSLSASAARYRRCPLSWATSRLTVEGDRPRRPAMRLGPIPVAGPREISSRSGREHHESGSSMRRVRASAVSVSAAGPPR